MVSVPVPQECGSGEAKDIADVANRVCMPGEPFCEWPLLGLEQFMRANVLSVSGKASRAKPEASDIFSVQLLVQAFQ